MARRRRKRDAGDDGSLDSLLDTMTNVVGILVIVLIVVLLSATDAVKAIIRAESGFDLAEVTSQQVQQATSELARLEAEITQLEQQAPQLQASLDEKRLELLDLTEALDAARAASQPVEAVSTQALEQQVKELEQAASELEQKVRDHKTQLEALEQQLAATPKLEDQAATVIRLPDPRPAPEGAQQEFFLCREGKIYPVNLTGLQSLAARLAKQFGSIGNGEIDCDKLVSAFEQRDLGNETFRIRIRIVDHRPLMVFERRPEAGESLEAVRKADSDFQRTLRRMNSKKQYCRFLVWNDSFETYLEARTLADERGMLAGWEPTALAEEWYAGIPGVSHLRCRGAPPPPPAKPRVAGGPPPPPRPVDVVD